MFQPIENRIPESDTQNRQPPVHRVTFFETNLGGRDIYSSESILGRESVQVARRMGVSTGTSQLIVVRHFLSSVLASSNGTFSSASTENAISPCGRRSLAVARIMASRFPKYIN